MSAANDSARLSALESRVTVLETQVGYLTSRTERAESKIEAFSDRITRAEEAIKHLPSKGFIVTAVVMALSLLGALVLFQANVRALTGAGTPTPTATPPHL